MGKYSLTSYGMPGIMCEEILHPVVEYGRLEDQDMISDTRIIFTSPKGEIYLDVYNILGGRHGGKPFEIGSYGKLFIGHERFGWQTDACKRIRELLS